MPASVFRFLSLRPGPALYERLAAYKRRTRDRVGSQLYLDDPPHLTLYLAAFPTDVSLLHLAANVLINQGPVRVRLTGWHSFLDDALTGRNTLVCAIDADDQERLRNLQYALIAAMYRYRDPAATRARFSSRWEHLSPERRGCVEQFGFPFLGADWHPHFTIASIDQSDWPAAMQLLDNDPPTGDFDCTTLTEYVLIDGVPREVESRLLGRRAA